MGLDIFIKTDKEIVTDKIRDNLSRVFVRLILRQHDNNDEEINQIAQISKVDLNTLLHMSIPDISHLLFQLDDNENGEEIKRIEYEIEKTKEAYSKDINLVVDTLEKLDQKLKENPEYYKQLKLTEPIEEYVDYFKNYSIAVISNENGLISNSDTNFGVDIRTLLNYLKYAKSQGATRTYFIFG